MLAVLEHQGKLNLVLENNQGALKSFQKMREIANEFEDRLQEMRAFLMIARTLQHMTNYK